MSLLVALTISWSAHADIIDVLIPDVQIPYTATADYFTVEADITGSFDIAGYSLLLKLTPVGDASGVTFHSATGSIGTDPDYIFTGSDGWQTALGKDPLIPGNDPMQIGGSDGL